MSDERLARPAAPLADLYYYLPLGPTDADDPITAATGAAARYSHRATAGSQVACLACTRCASTHPASAALRWFDFEASGHRSSGTRTERSEERYAEQRREMPRSTSVSVSESRDERGHTCRSGVRCAQRKAACNVFRLMQFVSVKEIAGARRSAGYRWRADSWR